MQPLFYKPTTFFVTLLSMRNISVPFLHGLARQARQPKHFCSSVVSTHSIIVKKDERQHKITYLRNRTKILLVS